MLEPGELAFSAEQAQHEAIAPYFMTAVLLLTRHLLDIVMAILFGRRKCSERLAGVLEQFTVKWDKQRR